MDFVTTHFPFSQLKPVSIKKICKKSKECDFIFVIPQGPKAFLWFQNNKCFLIYVDRQNWQKIDKVKVLSHIFVKPKMIGSILYGTLVSQNNNSYLALEDIQFYENNPVHDLPWSKKFEIIGDFLNNHLYYKDGKHGIILGLPLFFQSWNNLEDMEQKLCYKPYCLLSSSLERKDWFKLEEKKEKEKEKENFEFDQSNILDMLYEGKSKAIKKPEVASKPLAKKEVKEKRQILLFKPDLQNDIYHIFSKDGVKSEGIAHIPNYETSVMLNQTFRKIKENLNLDALEESDDEEEFEDNRDDKFVNLERTALFECVYNFKFKKWTPIKRHEN